MRSMPRRRRRHHRLLHAIKLLDRNKQGSSMRNSLMLLLPYTDTATSGEYVNGMDGLSRRSIKFRRNASLDQSPKSSAAFPVVKDWVELTNKLRNSSVA